MNADESPQATDSAPPIRTCRNDWWRVLLKALLCLLAGAMISSSLVGIRGYEVAYRLNSRPAFGAQRVGPRLLLEKLEKESVEPAAEKAYMKEAFARQLQGMTWTWDGELKPAQP